MGSASVHDDLLQLNTIALTGTDPFVCDTQEQAKRYVAPITEIKRLLFVPSIARRMIRERAALPPQLL